MGRPVRHSVAGRGKSALREIFFAFIRVHSRSLFACIRGFFFAFLAFFRGY